MSTLVIEALREKLSARKGYDYIVKMLNGGEVGISAMTNRAQQRSRLQAGYTIAFRSRFEATEYVEVAEAEGFTFEGKEVLSPVVACARVHGSLDEGDITEPVILLKPAQLYRPGMSGTQLYDVTRGVWKVNRQRALRASFAFAVADGGVVEIYEIHDWHPANSTPYPSGRQDQADPKYAKRFEFTGKVAPSGIQNKYLGQLVGHLFGRGQVIRYLNC